jgi:DUF4097 and DUF4098 domain-containing protein YvlB
MAQQCTNCGKELYAGQRFCRYCGKQSGQFQEEQIPTQMMPSQPDTAGSHRATDTSPTSTPRTSPFYPPQPQPQGYYQPPVVPVMPYIPPGPPKRSPWGWIIALVSIGLFAAMFAGVLFISRRVRRPARPDSPPQSVEQRAGEATLTEEVKTFPLTPDSKVSVTNISGEVSIEGWDQPQAEVRVTRRGGSPDDRRRVEVKYIFDGTNLTLRTAQNRNGIDVKYDIKLPRGTKLITVEGVSSDLNISDLNGPVSVNTQSGSIEMRDINGDVTASTASGSINISEIRGKISANSASGSIEIRDIVGTVKANTASGDMNVVFETVTSGDELKFSSASGDIELTFRGDINADLSAETVSGDIELDREFGIPVEKPVVGRRANGRIGQGGQRFKVNTVSGDIKITKED